MSTLADILGASGPLVSQHLAKQRLVGLVSARRVGKRQLYRVDDPHVVSLIDQAIDHHEDRKQGLPRAFSVGLTGLNLLPLAVVPSSESLPDWSRFLG